MTYLGSQTVALTTLNPTYSDANIAGNEFDVGDRTFFHVKNNSGGSVTLTFVDSQSVPPTGAYQFDASVVVVVEPSGVRFVGPFGSSRWTNLDDGLVHVTYDSVTSVKVAVLKLSDVVI